MKSIFAKTAFYTLTLLTPLAAQASHSEHEKMHVDLKETHHPEDKFLSQRGYVSTSETLPSASVPEPGSLPLVGVGIIGLALARYKKS